MLKVLYLCNKKYYETKMSRVRFHSIEALEKVTDLRWSGPSWDNYDDTKTVQENIDIIYPNDAPDVVIAYKPLEMKSFRDIKPLKCIRYNEMYDINLTFNEIMQTKPNIVICHHHNDYLEYKKRFENFSLFPLKFINIPHSGEKTIFRDYNFPKKYDLMIAGATGIRSTLGQHYPLRDRLLRLIPKLSNKYKCYIHRHPGYDHSDAHTDKYLIDFAKAINSSKICITCSGKPKSRFGKYIEIPMCATAIAGDIPDEHQEEFENFIIKLDMEMSDDEIINKLEFFIENDKEREGLVSRGLKYSQKYTQEAYAKRFIAEVEVEYEF